MKQIITQLMLFAFIYTIANAQDCPPQNVGKTPDQYKALIKTYCEVGNGISTNPANLQNPACPLLKNDFEWRIKQDPSTVSVNPEFYIVYDESGNPVGVRNPFNDPGNHEYDHIDNNLNSNYQPEDGWELLKVDFGALSNFNTGWNVNPENHPGLNPNLGGKKLPYMILYNKYTGTFRFFGTLLGQMQDYETVRIELRIPEISSNNQGQSYQELKATNLLSIQGDAVQPLDQETDENVLVVFAKATNNPSQFFWFDIPVAYDPYVGGMQMDRNENIEFRGNLITTKVNLQTNWWCDFVFAPDYKLRSLQEVESFINTNKHLPDMPSEVEVLENGIDVADMQALQQQKIEELTLYIIQLQKQMKVMKLELEDLKQ